MTDLTWFTVLFIVCLIFVAWAAEDENLQEKAERLSKSREIKRLCKRPKKTAPSRASRWAKTL